MDAKNLDLVFRNQKDVDYLIENFPLNLNEKWVDCKISSQDIICRYKIDDGLNVICVLPTKLHNREPQWYPIVISFEASPSRDLNVKEQNEAIEELERILTNINVKFKERSYEIVDNKVIEVQTQH